VGGGTTSLQGFAPGAAVLEIPAPADGHVRAQLDLATADAMVHVRWRVRDEVEAGEE
jgi:hypothetical protein